MHREKSHSKYYLYLSLSNTPHFFQRPKSLMLEKEFREQLHLPENFEKFSRFVFFSFSFSLSFSKMWTPGPPFNSADQPPLFLPPAQIPLLPFNCLNVADHQAFGRRLQILHLRVCLLDMNVSYFSKDHRNRMMITSTWKKWWKSVERFRVRWCEKIIESDVFFSFSGEERGQNHSKKRRYPIATCTFL